jgi:hypothetical protein
VRLWGDKKFRSLTPIKPSGQALFLYLLTNPNTTSLPGLFRAGAAAMAEELGWELKDFRQAFEEVLNQGLVKADFDARVVFIPNVIKYNKPQSPNVVKSWATHWDEIPECELKSVAYQALKDFVKDIGESFAEAFDEAINKPFCKSMPNQEQDQEQKQEQEQENNIREVLSTSPCVVSGKKTFSSEIKSIFEYWQQVMNHPRAKLDKKRQHKIKVALELGYSLDELKSAINGCANMPFNMGENEQGQRYDDITLILRDASHIDRFTAKINSTYSPKSQSTIMEGVI